MLTACGNSQTDGAMISAPAPVIERHTEVRTVCPAELAAPAPARPQVPDGAELHGNDAGMGWLGDVLAWAGALSGRFEDARKNCP